MRSAESIVSRARTLVGLGRGAVRRALPRRIPHVPAARILGIASTGHGASVAYLDADGTTRGSQLERWTGTKHMMMFSRQEDHDLRNPDNDIDRSINFVFNHSYGRFPDSRVFEDTMVPWLNWLLHDLHVTARDVDLVVTSDGHFATGWTRLGPQLRRWFPRARTVTAIEHHEVHQRQAFWASGFDEAAVLTLDTCGESLDRLGGRKLAGTIVRMDRDGGCKVLREVFFPDMSAGAMYDAATHHVGFRLGDAGKTMGLAPYGGPDLFDAVRPHLRLHPDGAYSFLSSDDFQAVLDSHTPARDPGAEMSPAHQDVAYAAQAVLEQIVVNAWRAALRLTGSRNLVYAGGVALNSVANELAWQATRPARLYIPPNPGDPGHALGCALFGAYEVAGWNPRCTELPEYLGPSYGVDEIEAVVSGGGVPVVRPAPPALAPRIARCIANGYIVARSDGGSEFGPRALGNRSILCDPRRPGMKEYLNRRVKHREPFRPFAPTVLEEHATAWFQLEGRSPYMLRVVPVCADRIGRVPAIAHVDGTARVQTLSRADNEGYWQLVTAFHELTGVPMVLNTSFNLAGKPIVETPRHAVDCFLSTEIDVLVLGPYVLSKQPLDDYLHTDSGA